MTKLTGANMNLTTQVAEHAKHLATKNSARDTMQKTVIQLHGEVNDLKSKLSDHTTKETNAIQHQHKNKKFN